MSAVITNWHDVLITADEDKLEIITSLVALYGSCLYLHVLLVYAYFAAVTVNTTEIRFQIKKTTAALEDSSIQIVCVTEIH